MKECLYYKKLKDKIVQCNLCPRFCVIKENSRGNCGVRENKKGKLYSLVYGKPVSARADPLTKKPIYHMLPGTNSFSIGTAGCNLHCLYCFTSDTNILIENGIFSIKDIFNKGFDEKKIGYGSVRKLNNPKTISHNGKIKEILHAFKHRYDGDIVKIKPYYSPEIKCTLGHEFFVCKDLKAGVIIKTKSEDICKNDYLIIPKIRDRKDINEILNIKNILSDHKVRVDKIPRKIAPIINELFAMKDNGVTSKEMGKKFNLNPTGLRNLFSRIKKEGKDFLFFKDINLIERGRYVKFKGTHGRGILSSIEITRDLGKVLGYYCAEGCVIKNKKRPNSYDLIFSFGKHEKKEVNEVKRLIKIIFGIDMKIRDYKYTTTAIVVKGNSTLALLFKKLCGSGAKNKKVPYFLYNCDKGVIKSFLEAYDIGDGWSGNGEHPISMNTVSERLALGVYFLLLKLNYLPGFYIWNAPSKKKLGNRIINQSTLYYVKMYAERFRKRFTNSGIVIHPKSERSIKFKENENYFFVPVRKISKEKYKGNVYNIEVKDDHSYLANFVAVGNCQNWEISQSKPEEVPGFDLSPENVVKEAIKNNCKSISYTYTDPIAFYQYTLDTAKLAKKKGLKNVIVCNGYINKEPLIELCKVIDAANIDFKAFNDKFYKEICGGKLKPVLEALKILKKNKIWLELTYLVIPGENDDMKEIEKMCKWIKKELGKEVPIHFSRFFPMYKMMDKKPTTGKTLLKVSDIAKKYLDYVYVGNIRTQRGENTYCPKCKELLIERDGFRIIQNNIKSGKCKCGEKIPGVWE